jgi:hypothetical protein
MNDKLNAAMLYFEDVRGNVATQNPDTLEMVAVDLDGNRIMRDNQRTELDIARENNELLRRIAELLGDKHNRNETR